MHAKELKLAIAEDVKTICTLEPEIIPGRIYYGAIFKLVSTTLSFFWLIATGTIAYSYRYHPTHSGFAEEPFMEVVRESSCIAFFMSIVGVLILFQAINFYFQFRFHLESKLKTGKLLVKKFKQIAALFIIVFSLFCAMFGSYGESAVIFMMVGFAFAGSLLVTYFLVSLELNRIGISAIFAVIGEFFHKDTALTKED